jgi:hypothetical protein
VMNHIPERRRFDEENTGHSASAGVIYRALSMTAITMTAYHAA